ncbi:hypothetical protein Tco_1345771 [Tanacetum coccineum]
MGEGSTNPTDPYHTLTIIQPSTSQPQKKQRSRRPKRKDTEIPQSSGPTDNVADEAVNKEMDDSLERVDVGYPLVPSCFVIFDLEPLSLSLDFVFSVRDL